MTGSDDGNGSSARRPENGGPARRAQPPFIQPRSLRPRIPRLPFSIRAVAAKIGANIRRVLGFAVMYASAPLRGMRSDDGLYARARLETAKIEERYFFEQVIAQNSERKLGGQPTGKIELALPYDGDKYLTRQALADIERGWAGDAGSARVGYLTLTGYQDTDLDGVLDLAHGHGSRPIDLPLGPPAAGDLVADRAACRTSWDYQPSMRLRDVYPLDIVVDLSDPDTAGFTDRQKVEDSEGERSKMMQHVSFRPELVLKITASLHVPRDLAGDAKVAVSEVSLEWPTHTSLGLLAVTANGEPHALRYNPVKASLEWFDVSMDPEPDSGSGDFVTFGSRQMELSIPQPGDLYDTEQLKGHVAVSIDRLLSGTDARLYDATGRQNSSLQPELKTVVQSDFVYIVEEAFTRRLLTPRQQMHFDEVIPNEMRIADIKNALTNLGYRVDDESHYSATSESWWWLTVWRTEGPERLWLKLFIEGRRYKARRRRQVPGGLTYQTNLESGDMRIYVYGSLPGNSEPVVNDVNALRRALDERFDRLPARR